MADIYADFHVAYREDGELKQVKDTVFIKLEWLRDDETRRELARELALRSGVTNLVDFNFRNVRTFRQVYREERRARKEESPFRELGRRTLDWLLDRSEQISEGPVHLLRSNF